MNTPFPTPPPSPHTGLTWYLGNAAQHERANSIKFPGIFALLEQQHAALYSALTAVQGPGDSLRMVPRFFLVRAYSSWLAAARLALSGQVVDASMPLRGAIEASWYALHIHEDPAPTSLQRLKAWADPTEKGAKRRRAEFSTGNVRKTHETRDPEVASIFWRLYQETIEAGAHPNPEGILGVLTEEDTGGETKLTLQVVTTDPRLIVAALKHVVDIGIGVLKTFRLIFEDEFRAARIEGAVHNLIVASIAAFRPWADQLRT